MADDEKYDYLYSGAFCVYTGQDPETGTLLVLVIKRGSHFKGTNLDNYGMPGGYAELKTRQEQPRETAIRENGEEIRLPDGSPVLTTLTPERLVLMDNGIDYSKGHADTRYAGVSWAGYRCTLDPSEVTVLKAHIAKMAADPDYAAAVREATDQETADVLLLPAADVPQMIRSGALPFAYAHEQKVTEAVINGLLQTEARPVKRLNF